MGVNLSLVFDGGSRGNPGPAFGSYRLQRSGRRPRPPVRLTFGRGTNNEAEYWTLIAALEGALELARNEGLDPGEVELEVRGDSQLVIRQLRGEWKAKDARMRRLRDRARALLERFARTRLVHHDRSRSVEILGH